MTFLRSPRVPSSPQMILTLFDLIAYDAPPASALSVVSEMGVMGKFHATPRLRKKANNMS